MDDLVNMEPDLPPLEELETIRQKLTEQIEEAEQMFCVESNGHELQTTRSALKFIEEAIKQSGQQEVA